MKFIVPYDLVWSPDRLVIEANSREEAITKAGETLNGFIGAYVSLDFGRISSTVEDYEIVETAITEEPDSAPAQAD